ncbi:Beta-N-acetylhexosaminidase [Flavobacterium sp. 9AF]|uniref:beta-N-acetylhexosaminidase n=1 Tax=Flavobacterium sp. 9AF TaxID=2653142 RepID=UPI0012EEE9FC|nr:family 20 glycosylhydrolase [Flavobacterium sp. 9AF]VXB98638.1 Beta-N-acetylhexosaminidase [Flavobacterium sp. 9AF]
MNLKIILFVLLLNGTIFSQNKSIEQLNLIPWPQNIILNEGGFIINTDFKINISGHVNPRIFKASTNFLRRLDGRTGLFFKQGYITNVNEEPKAQLQINCNRAGQIGLYEDESYTIEITSNKINITSITDLGAIHALETLLQLLQNSNNQFYFPNSSISDQPVFKWRGLMIDVARHFQPVDVLKRNLDAMAAVKLNVFHWHLVDDQGWRIELKGRNKLTQLASDGLFYTQEQIKDVVKYADEKGILVVPEIDVPGHASAILTAYPEIGSKYKKSPKEQNNKTYSVERNAGIFTPTLDPSNPETYKVLKDIFDEVCPLFPGKYFHIGGDENEGKDWDANPVIQDFKKRNNLKSNHELQSYFTLKLVPILQKNDKIIVGWEEIMNEKMPKETIIHSWKGANEGSPAGKSLIDAVRNGYKTILSNGFYIDLMQSIKDHYESPIIPKDATLSKLERENILGGEATMWSELVSPLNIDSRIWPRTIVIAELFWSNPNDLDFKKMYKRVANVSNRLEELGITHIRNKEVILRNIANYTNYDALEKFSKICEPLKIYSRNKGGIEYQMYSPLTLFADACNVDAEEALQFNLLVNEYLSNKCPDKLKEITHFLNDWKKMHQELLQSSENAPLIKQLLPLSERLNILSNELLEIIENNKKYDNIVLNKMLNECNSKEYADVELAVYPGLKKIIESIN